MGPSLHVSAVKVIHRENCVLDTPKEEKACLFHPEHDWGSREEL